MRKVEEFNNLTDFVSDKFLAVNNCGFTVCTTEQTVLRSKGRKDYHLIYVTKGEYVVYTENGEEHLREGHILFYRPGEKQYYSFGKGSEAYWGHFTGTAADEIFSILDMKMITNAGIDRRLTDAFNGIISNFETDKDNLLSISYLMNFCAEARKIVNSNKKQDIRIEKVKDYINANYNQNHSLDFYAKMCNLSTDRFSHLFKKETGVSPHKYILEIRLRQVRYLLVYSNMNISEIAAATGFDDALYLSRIFKKYHGTAPKNYRQ